MRDLIIIPCGAAKLDHAAPAAELYTGSMFKDALRTARTIAADEDIRIMSAMHGLVRLDHVIEPYEMKISDKNSVTGFRLVMQLVGMKHEGNLMCFLPKAYLKRLISAGNAAGCHVWDLYADCPGIGYQKARLKAVREKASAR
jgi:hypothetical protein